MKLADGNSLTRVKGRGSGELKYLDKDSIRSLNVRDLLYVPEIDLNLLSVKKFDKKGYMITFEGGVCSILNGDVYITAKISADLYRVNAVEQACVVLDNQHGVNCQHM